MIHITLNISIDPSMKSKTRKGTFPETRWTLIQQALSADEGEAAAAVATLCGLYWEPIFLYYLRSGKSSPDAQDLTQNFFAGVLRKNVFAAAKREKGKLRNFLLTSAGNFLRDEIDRAKAKKNGPPMIPRSDIVRAEHRYLREPLDTWTPDRLFFRRWTLNLLDRSLDMLAREYLGPVQKKRFEALRPFLEADLEAGTPYASVAASLGMEMGALKSQVFRFRKRWREIFRRLVEETLDEPTPEETSAEITALLGSL